MRITGDISKIRMDESFDLENTQGERVFSLTKLGAAFSKVTITGLDNKHNYFGDMRNDEGSDTFMLFENEQVILEIIKKDGILGRKYQIESDIGEYEVNFNAIRSKFSITNAGEEAVNYTTENGEFDMIINNTENPVLMLAIVYGITILG